MDYLKLSSGLGTTYERCIICNWYELDPYNVAPHHRHVENGVCHVCRAAVAGTQFVPSVTLPDPFEGTLGGGIGVEDLSPPLEVPPGALRMAQDGYLAPPPTLPTLAKETPLNEPSDQAPSTLP